jgi:autotransporter-associated beta strand protein
MKQMMQLTWPSVVSSILIAAAVTFCSVPQSHAQETDTWTGTGSDTTWTNSGNWTYSANGTSPQPGDSLVFAGANTANNNNFPNGTAFDGITLGSGSSFTLSGNSLLLSGQTNGNTIGLLNTSGATQTVGLNLNLDWGYYTFSSPDGGTLALNGASALTPNLGAVAYFDLSVTSPSLGLDATTGLITGLEGAGLLYDGTYTPTSLATISGQSIQAYSAYTPYTGGGAIASGNNLNLADSGASASYTANNNTVNTISAAQAGGATTTLAVTGTLTLGQNGGVYVLEPSAGSYNCFNLSGGTLTAGASSSPASIVFAVNGNNANNQATVSSAIANNAAGGPVTVVKTGPGSMNFATTTASTYTGGVYVDQGQLQWSQTQQLGPGPLYVASGASACFNAASGAQSALINNIYLSPGYGSATAAAISQGGALILAPAGSAFTLGGTLTLMGEPVTAPPGDRICNSYGAGGNTIYITNQITGTGTFELWGLHGCIVILSNTSSATPNNWTGGVIIGSQLGNVQIIPRLRMGALNQLPNGPGTGDIFFAPLSYNGNSYSALDPNGFNTTVNALVATPALSPGSYTTSRIVNSGGACTLTFGANNHNGEFDGRVDDTSASHPLSLNKTGIGTQTFGGPLVQHGATTVSAGTLAYNYSTSIPYTPSINVAAGTTLDVSATPGTFSVVANQTLNSISRILGSLSVSGGLSALMTTIGTFAVPGANANVTFNSSSTYVWDINNATGTAGADPGWGLLSVANGTITINTPMTINIVSLTGSDQPGNVTNFNTATAYSFPIAYASGGIGSFNASQVAINTSGFSNYPASASQWSVSLDNTGDYLLLKFNPFNVITALLTNETVNASATAAFTVTANPLGSNPTFQWTEGLGDYALVNGGYSLGGAAVSITTNGHSCTLTLSGVQDGDTGNINVSVTTTYNSAQQAATSIATLFVVDPPYDLEVGSALGVSLPMTPVAQGAAVQLTATQYGGNGTLSYQWYLGSAAIAGATNSFYQVNASPATVGSYYCVVSNQAGSATNTSPAVLPGPLTTVPNQMIFEPYNYVFQQNGGLGTWNGLGATNVYNQFTGVGLGWIVGNGSGDGECLNVNWNQHYVGNPPGIYGEYPNDNWPWEGLADSFDPGQAGILPGASGVYEQTGASSSIHLPFGPGGSISNGTVYLSWVINMGQGGAMTAAGYDYLCGFGYNNGDPTTVLGHPNAGLYILTPGDDTYRLGAFKTGTTVAGPSLGSVLIPGYNGNWASNIVLIRDTTLLAVCRLTVRTNGGSSIALWIDPPTNTFYASEANVPPADVVDSDSVNAPDAAPSADYFYDKWSDVITSRSFAILRIGTTWASVTPPATPTLSLNNVVLTACAPATAVLTSQNAGNPVTAGYGWTFNNGSGPVTLSDGPNPNNDGSAFSGTATNVLTITGVTAAEVGTYTVTGTNLDQNTFTDLVGSASGTLSFLRPALSIAYNGPALVVSWPTNTPSCFALNQTATLTPPVAWTPASGGTAGTSGANHTYTINPAPATPRYYQLVGAP